MDSLTAPNQTPHTPTTKHVYNPANHSDDDILFQALPTAQELAAQDEIVPAVAMRRPGRGGASTPEHYKGVFVEQS